ncbi:hypothetical protein ACQEU8_35930 [Streptomyces sp. CA-250714]|uniref:hypothetical protein n=1 Tax=Streptomyces sp. CA-250714 TaxID=3240060 RepID=UPI003D9128D7
MSSMTAPARPRLIPGQRRRDGPRLVPVQAGPVPEYGPAHPLALAAGMRARLRTVVHTLLAHPDLAGAPDPVRLAVLVLASRTNATSLEAEVTTRELGQWIGLSAERASKAVVRPLRAMPMVDVETRPGEYAEDAGLRCRLRPLAEASDRGLLGLSKKELAVLHRLVEAVMAPGWFHRDGRVTPAGLLGCRTGRGAATDRLALLLLVLEAGEDGIVPLCGGRVDIRRGRVVATLARLLGCKRAGAEAVLTRLEEAGAVARPRRRTASGLHQKSQLVVPAVAAAHRSVTGREDRRHAPRPFVADPDDATGPGQPPTAPAKPQVVTVPGPARPEKAEPDDATPLHTHHSPGAGRSRKSDGGGGFSGEAPSGTPGRPGRAGARGEHPRQAVAAHTTAAGSGLGPLPHRGGGGSALRAEKHNPPAPSTDPVACPFLGRVARNLPRTSEVLQRLLPEPTAYQRRLLDRMLGGLIAEGDDDAMIASRLRQRLAKLVTGDPERPYRFRRDALSWALSIGLPLSPGGRTLVPCAVGGCEGRIYGRVADLRIRCDDCELEALSRLEAVQARRAIEAALEAPLPPPAPEVTRPEPTSGDSPAGPAGSPGLSHCPQPGGEAMLHIPLVVREQIDLLERIDPAAARTARRAAAIMYRPDPHGEGGDRARERAWAASAWTAVFDRYTDQLTAHYAQTTAGAA